MNKLLSLFWRSREAVLKVFEPKDQFDQLVYRLENLNTRFLRNVLSYNNITARVRSLQPSSKKLDNYLKWVVSKERDEDLASVISLNTAESSVYITDFFSDKGALQDAVAEFENLKPSMIRFIRLYQTYELRTTVSFERDYFLRTMKGHLIGLQHLIEDLHGLSIYGVTAVRE